MIETPTIPQILMEALIDTIHYLKNKEQSEVLAIRQLKQRERPGKLVTHSNLSKRLQQCKVALIP